MTLVRLDRSSLVDVAITAAAEVIGLAVIYLRYRHTHPTRSPRESR